MPAAIATGELHMPGESMPRCEFDSKDLIMRFELTIAADVKAITPSWTV